MEASIHESSITNNSNTFGIVEWLYSQTQKG